MVADGEFREDLYYRLNVIPVVLPSLRQRKEDIPLLVEYFMQTMGESLHKKINGITKDALKVFMQYRWPGNVRELENIMERLITLADAPCIGIEALPNYMREEAAASSGPISEILDGNAILPWDTYEKMIIQQALKKYKTFNRAAKALHITHKTVAAKARKYGLEKKTTWEKV